MADTIPDFDPMTVPIKAAATVMMVRDAQASDEPGLEVFMLRRTGKASFGAGMYVFPGGRVDDVDPAIDVIGVDHFQCIPHQHRSLGTTLDKVAKDTQAGGQNDDVDVT